MAPWLAAAGAFVVSLDSMMNVAFPSMATAFGVPPETIRWVIICYTGVYAVTAFAGGAVADLVGHVRVFRLGVAMMALALFAGGVLPTFEGLLVARVAQGLSAGFIYGTAPGIVTLATAVERRGRALGAFSAAMALGLALGPLPAGLLVDVFGWRAVMFARVPLALAVLAGTLALRVDRGERLSARFVTLADVRRAPVPVACVLAFLAQAGIFAIWLLIPFDLVQRHGFGASMTGAIFTLTPLGTTLAAPIAGRMADRIGPGIPLIVGLLLETAGLGALAFTDARTPTMLVAAALFAAGLGVGIFQVPVMTLVMNAFPAQLQGAAGGLAFLSRTLGLVSGVALLATLFAARRAAVGIDAAFTDSFLCAAAIVTLGAVIALVRVRHLRAGGERR